MKKILLIAAVCFCCAATFAQEKKEKFNPEQMIEMRVGMMQQKLMLDDATAAKFAPIYKEYLQALGECFKPCGQCENPTDSQIKENIGKRLEAQQKVLDIKEKYFKKLSSILSGRQLQQIFCNEDKPFGGKWGKKGDCGKRDGKKWGKKPCMKAPANCPKMPGNCPKAKDACPKVGACPKADACPKAGACPKADACPQQNK